MLISVRVAPHINSCCIMYSRHKIMCASVLLQTKVIYKGEQKNYSWHNLLFFHSIATLSKGVCDNRAGLIFHYNRQFVSYSMIQIIVQECNQKFKSTCTNQNYWQIYETKWKITQDYILSYNWGVLVTEPFIEHYTFINSSVEAQQFFLTGISFIYRKCIKCLDLSLA